MRALYSSSLFGAQAALFLTSMPHFINISFFIFSRWPRAWVDQNWGSSAKEEAEPASDDQPKKRTR
jgi:hypothetical protein